MTGIPKDAREVYCNEKGEPIAFCPVEGIGITDVERVKFFMLNEDRLRQLAKRARVKSVEESEPQGVICIDVDDPTWTFLVDMLMPGHDWDIYRSRGEKPIARGVVPLGLIKDVVKELYPAGDEFSSRDGVVNMAVFAAYGVSIFSDHPKKEVVR
jgi:hypothetical protein